MIRVQFIFGKRSLEIEAAQLFKEGYTVTIESTGELLSDALDNSTPLGYRSVTGQWCYINLALVQEIRYK